MAKKLEISLIFNAINKISPALSKINKGLATTGGKMQALSARMRSGFSATSMLLKGAAVAGMFKISSDWEHGLAKISTLTEGGMENVKKIFEKDFFDIARTMGLSLGTVSEAAYQSLSASVKQVDLIPFMKVASKAALGGFTDIKTAVDGLTSVMNAWGTTTVKDAKRISDAMIVTQNVGKTTLGEIAQAIGQVGPIAAKNGVKIEDLLSGIAALTQTGSSGASAVTMLRSVLVSASKVTPKAKKVLKELGITFDANTIKTMGLTGSIQYLSGAIKAHTGDVGKQREMLSAVIGRVEGLNGALNLSSKEGLAAYNKALKQMTTQSGQTEKAAAKMANTTTVKFRKLKVELQILAVKVSSALLPVLKSLFDTISSVVGPIGDWIAANDDAVKVIGVLIGALVGLQGLLWAISFLLGPIGTLMVVFGGKTAGASGAIGGLEVAVIGLKKAFYLLKIAMVAHPILMIGAILAIAAITIMGKWGDLKDWFFNFFGWIWDRMKAFGSAIIGLFTNPIETIKEIWNGMIKNILASYRYVQNLISGSATAEQLTQAAVSFGGGELAQKAAKMAREQAIKESTVNNTENKVEQTINIYGGASPTQTANVIQSKTQAGLRQFEQNMNKVEQGKKRRKFK